ncbi:MAG TPA: hypothetical protein VHM19_22660 [Polyangiales bacterium]|nr:hypothetical protein [Polyangiales bacterium]
MSEKRRRRKDIAILGGPTEDGQGAQLLRLRDGQLSAGEIRPVKEGQAITHSEVVRLHPIDESNRVCSVEVLHAPSASTSEPSQETDERSERATPRTRPARVTSSSYRKNYDAIFDAKKKPRAKWSVN